VVQCATKLRNHYMPPSASQHKSLILRERSWIL